MVARATLHNMHQDRDETVRAFGARPGGHAGVTYATSSFPPPTGLTQIIKDALSRGLEDSDIQLDLLDDRNQEMTLEEFFRFVEAKESGKRSASRLVDSHVAEAASAYRRNKKADINTSRDPCNYFDKKGYDRQAPTKVRKKDCPAYVHTCSQCTK